MDRAEAGRTPPDRSESGSSTGWPAGTLAAGKLPADLLDGLISRLPPGSRRILAGPGIGEDAAVISFGSSSLVAKVDPVTFATDLIGWYVVHVNANDIAATGATPRWFMPTVLLPENTPVSTVDSIFRQIADASESIGVEVIGGHTEITVDLPRPIITGAMLGEAPASRTVSTAGALTGDSVILTKGIAIEGGSLLAREFGERARAGGVSDSTLERAADYLFDPGISVLRDAQIATASGAVTAMHDPTEGGLATALVELATASKKGMLIDSREVPVLEECEWLCGALSVDPWGLISSGSLLVTCRPGSETQIVDALRSAGIAAAKIGEMTEAGEAMEVIDGSGAVGPAPSFERDEFARLFSG